MFELYNCDNRISKDTYDIIYKIMTDNYFEINNEEDNNDIYNIWLDTINNTKDYNILIYYINNEIVGFIAFMYIDNYLCLSEVQFDKKYKNKGYLKKLLSEVIRISDKSKYNKIYGTIDNNNTLSKQVFTHIGLKNTINNRYEIDCDELDKWLNSEINQKNVEK